MGNEEQLAALARASGLLTEAGIEHWLLGGWAGDFYVGEITRPHDDLDLAIWHEDLVRIARLLGATTGVMPPTRTRTAARASSAAAFASS